MPAKLAKYYEKEQIMPLEDYTLKRSNINSSEDKNGIVTLKGVKYFSIEKTFDCGQCFRFEKCDCNSSSPECDYDEMVKGVAFGRLVAFARRGDDFFVIGSTLDEYKNIWRHFLGFDVNYPKLCEHIVKENEAFPVVHAAECCANGIRILSQDPFETLISFIISQNNNIPRIKSIIEKLCRACGDRFVGFDGEEHFAFPTAKQILKEGEYMLKNIGAGFRAKYIIDACERIDAHRIDFDYIRECDDVDECIRHLCEIYGVGVKVASCTLLFAFEKFDAYPEDTWIRKVHAKYFPTNFDNKTLGEFCGLVQQWLFFYERYYGGNT